MGRETEHAREVMEKIGEMFPGKQMLNVTEACRFTGLNYRTAKKILPFRDNYISVVKLANYMG